MVSHHEFTDDCVVSPWAASLSVLLIHCKTLEEKALSLNQLSEFPEKIKERGNKTRVCFTCVLSWNFYTKMAPRIYQRVRACWATWMQGWDAFLFNTVPIHLAVYEMPWDTPCQHMKRVESASSEKKKSPSLLSFLYSYTAQAELHRNPGQTHQCQQPQLWISDLKISSLLCTVLALE